jgi:hypothetical protein
MCIHTKILAVNSRLRNCIVLALYGPGDTRFIKISGEPYPSIRYTQHRNPHSLTTCCPLLHAIVLSSRRSGAGRRL